METSAAILLINYQSFGRVEKDPATSLRNSPCAHPVAQSAAGSEPANIGQRAELVICGADLDPIGMNLTRQVTEFKQGPGQPLHGSFCSQRNMTFDVVSQVAEGDSQSV